MVGLGRSLNLERSKASARNGSTEEVAQVTGIACTSGVISVSKLYSVHGIVVVLLKD